MTCLVTVNQHASSYSKGVGLCGRMAHFRRLAGILQLGELRLL